MADAGGGAVGLSGEHLAAIEARAQAATAGPWMPYFSVHGDPYVVPAHHRSPLMYRIADVSTSPDDYGRANAEFIGSTGPDVVLALVGEVRRLREAEARVREIHYSRDVPLGLGRSSPVCSECDYPCPCPTVAALGSPAGSGVPGEEKT